MLSYVGFFRYAGGGPLAYLFLSGFFWKIYLSIRDKENFSIVDYYTLLAIILLIFPQFTIFSSIKLFIVRFSILAFGPVYIFISVKVLLGMIETIFSGFFSQKFDRAHKLRRVIKGLKEVLILGFIIESICLLYVFDFREASIHLRPFINKDLLNDLKRVKKIFGHENLTFIIFPSYEINAGGDTLYHLDAWIGAIVGPHLTYVGGITFFLNGIFMKFEKRGFKWVKIFRSYFEYFGVPYNETQFDLIKLLRVSEVIVLERLYYPLALNSFEKKFLIEIDSGIYKLNESLIMQLLKNRTNELFILPDFRIYSSNNWIFIRYPPIVNDLRLNEEASMGFEFLLREDALIKGVIAIWDANKDPSRYVVITSFNNTTFVQTTLYAQNGNILYFYFSLNFTNPCDILFETKIISKVPKLSLVGLMYIRIIICYSSDT